MNAFWYRFLSGLPLGGCSIYIRDGRAFAVRGKVTQALLTAVSNAAETAGISAACIQATTPGKKGRKLIFFGVPADFRQRFRNVWAAHGR